MPRVSKRKVACRKVKQIVKRKRITYSVEQKIEVVTYAEEHGNNKAAVKFDINRSMIGHWVLTSSTWNTDTNGKSKRIGSGRKAFFPEAKKRLYKWTIEQRKQGLAVSYVILRSKMLEILREADMLKLYGVLTENFKTSHRWLKVFLKRYKLTL